MRQYASNMTTDIGGFEVRWVSDSDGGHELDWPQNVPGESMTCAYCSTEYNRPTTGAIECPKCGGPPVTKSWRPPAAAP